MAPNPFQRDPHHASQCGRIGGYAKAAKYPPDQLTGAARRGFMARFEPADPELDPTERQRRTQAAFKAHMSKLARLSAKARRRRNPIQASTVKNITNTDRTRMSNAPAVNASDKLIPEAIPNA